ncbi:hypothetical protein Ancab_037964, partial [Ancistrocladus abbreviatus]
MSGSTKYQHRLMNLLLKNLDDSQSLNGKLVPSTILVGSKDYQVRRRLGNGDDDKKECFLVTELMSRNLCSYMKDLYSSRKRVPFSLSVAVDIMLQIARGMEYLHSKKIYHGDLNPTKVLVRARSTATEGFLQVKVAGFGLSSASNLTHHNPKRGTLLRMGCTRVAKYTGKSDVYSFGMIYFEMLTGKVPFDAARLQGDKMSRNIRAGERPLFPFCCSKYMITLTKTCWHFDPNQRPSFSSICIILRHIKRFLMLNPDQGQADFPIPPVDYHDIETGLLNKFPSWENSDPFPVSEIPFQMFAYRVMERERCVVNFKDTSELGSEGASISGDET